MHTSFKKIILFLILFSFLGTSLLIPVSSANNWPLFHRDAQRTGYTDMNGPDTNNLLWKKTVDTDLGKSSPAIVDGKIFLTTYNTGKVICLYASNGTEIWSYTTGGKIYSSSPAVTDNKVFVGSRDGYLYCFEKDTGSLLWRFNTNKLIESSPLPYDDVVTVAVGRILYCLYQSNGTQKWIYSFTGDELFHYASPALYDNYLYLSSNSLHCLYKNNGTRVWSFPLYASGAYVTPTIANDRVFVGDINGVLYAFDATPDDYEGMVFDEESDEDDPYPVPPDHPGLLWAKSRGVFFSSSSAVKDERLYIGIWGTKTIECYHTSNGTRIWSFAEKTSGNTAESAPIVAQNKVYIGTNEKKIWCLDADSGMPLWNYTTNGNIVSSPVLYDQKLYVTSRDGTLYCFRANTEPPTPAKPQGITEGELDVDYTFLAASVTDPQNDIVQYQFSWGDGTDSDWLDHPFASHSYNTIGIYEVKLKAKDSYELESTWSAPLSVTILLQTPSALILDVDAAATVIEATVFRIAVRSQAFPLANAEVLFNQETKKTDSTGYVFFEAPQVIKDTSYTLTVSKKGYQAVSKIILVKNIDETKNQGWVFGTITDSQGTYLPQITVCVQSMSSSQNNKCVITDEKGRFVMVLSPGVYNLYASAKNYLDSTLIPVEILDNVALEQNIILEQIPFPTDKSLTPEMDILEYVIQEKIIANEIGAKITVDQEKTPIVRIYESVGILVHEQIQENVFSFEISSEAEDTVQTMFVLKITDAVDYYKTKDISQLEFFFDEQKIPMSSFSGFFETSLPDVIWTGIYIDNTLYIFSKTPLSTHVISIRSILEYINIIPAVIFYGVLCILGAVSFVYPFVVWPWRMKKKDK